MSHRKTPHIGTYTPQDWVEVLSAEPGKIFLLLRAPTPEGSRTATDHHRHSVTPILTLDSATNFVTRFHGLAVAVVAVPGSEGEWAVSATLGALAEDGAFRQVDGVIHWQADARVREISQHARTAVAAS